MNDGTGPLGDGRADAPVQRVRIAILGAGFSGLGMAIRLRQAGIRDFVVLERAGDVGGTWWANSYPGCAVDVRSHLYSYSFAPNPDWTELFAGQEEIRRYIKGVAERHDVLRHVRLNTEVLAGSWQEPDQSWRLDTSTGPVRARFVVSALGPLSTPALPGIPGLDGFAGTMFHSARWDHDHDLTGRAVGVIGTGSSAAQFVPEIAPKAGRLTVFQRTPHWTFPRRNRRITGVERALYRRVPAAQRLVRLRQYYYHELVLGSAIQRPWLTETISRMHLRRQVPDPALRAALTPHYRMGCKRIVITDAFLPALSRPNVELVTDPVVEVTPAGVRTADGREHRLDTLILGTGFSPLTVPDPLRGRDGDTLTRRWHTEGGQAYLGTTVAGFPNYFMLVGPNTGTGHTSILLYAEPQIEYVLAALRHLERGGLSSLDVRREVQDAFNADLQRRLRATVWAAGGCRSWYLDENGRNTALWPGHTWSFRRALRRFEPGDYRIRRQPEQAPEPVSAS